MTLLTRIKEQIVPITIEAVILTIGFFTFMKMPPQGTAEDIFAWFLLLVAFCVVFSIFPAIAIIYGWYTGNKVGAVLAGALPFPLLFNTVFFLVSSGNMRYHHFYRNSFGNLWAYGVLCSAADEKLSCGIGYSHRNVAYCLDEWIQLKPWKIQCFCHFFFLIVEAVFHFREMQICGFRKTFPIFAFFTENG